MKPALLLAILLSLCAVAAGAQVPDPDAAIIAGKAPLPGLHLTLIAPKTQYEQGEPIEVTMRYTYTGTRPLAVEVVTYDRSGRIMDFGFTAKDAQGRAVADPTPFQGGMGGGLRNETTLTSAKPYEQKAIVNEWLRFDTPGVYTLTAHSAIVSLNDNRQEFSTGPRIPLDSPPLLVTITAPDEAHRQARLAQDKTDLESSDPGTRVKALRDLRFMIDERAIPFLVQGLADAGGNAAFEARFGLRSFPDMALIKAAVLKAVNSPAFPSQPGRQWPYQSLLVEADLRAQGKSPTTFDPQNQAVQKKWDAFFAERQKAQLKTLSPVKAAEATVEGLALASLSHTDPANWKRVFTNAARMSVESQDYAASVLEDLPLFKDTGGLNTLKTLQPQLNRLVTETRCSGKLRSAALVLLHSFGHDPYRALLVSDVIAAKPQFTTAAHATLKTWKSEEVGEGLVRLMASSDEDVRQSAAERLRDFGSAVPAATLVKLLQSDTGGNFQTHDALLEALALKSPDDALPFIQNDLGKPHRTYMGVSDTPIRLLCRMNSPAARAVIHGLFNSPNFQDRETVAQALGQSWEETQHPEQSSFSRAERHMPPNAQVTASFFPDLLTLYQNDLNGEVRIAARNALALITGIPKNGIGQVTQAQEAAWVPQWQAWWNANRARYGQ